MTAKRFWKTVGIEHQSGIVSQNIQIFNPTSFLQLCLDFILVTLDKRPLKTPAGATLSIPKSKRLLATLIAHEWDSQETLIKPFALPMVCCSYYLLLVQSHRLRLQPPDFTRSKGD